MKTFRTDPDRFGIRARLLTLLLPAIVGLLALDSWNDHRALSKLVQDAYDHAMLETVKGLQGKLSAAPDGSLRLATPVNAGTILDDATPPGRYLHVGLTPLGKAGHGAAASAPERTLLGEADLPAPPPQPPAQSLPQSVVAAHGASAGAAAPAGAASNGSSSPVWYDSYYRGHAVRVVALQSRVIDGHGRPFILMVQATDSTEARDHAQATSTEQALIRDARMVLVVILLVWLGVTWSLHPLEKLRKSVLQGRGQDLKPLDTSGVPHEVFPLVDAVNQHVASYRELLDQQGQFLADASHQLRTPLAIMLTQASVALREKDPALVQVSLRAMVVQVQRSRRLCEQLLSLAHANDSSTPIHTPDTVDLNDIAKDVVLQCLALAHEKDQDLGWIDAAGDLPAPPAQSALPALSVPSNLTARPTPSMHQAGHVVPVLARGPELHEALTNLVHNAIVYTPVGGRITVLTTLCDGMALAEVHDNGPGIPLARRTAVFERFHHTGEVGSASPKTQRGAGLGLSIARAYARRNGGDIELADLPADGLGLPPATGLRAILRLPLAPVPQA